MLRHSLFALLIVFLGLPSLLVAEDNLACLDALATARESLQPGLENYLATVATSRIEQLMTGVSSDMPADVKPPTPVVTRFWQRDGKSSFYVKPDQQTLYVEEMLRLLASELDLEPNGVLLPAPETQQRRKLLKEAQVKSSEVALTDTLMQRLEITFGTPTNIGESFYASGMGLPDKHVKSLIFDIDSKTNTVSELGISSDDGQQLAMEIRYREVAGGYLPERIHITSPDGKTDSLLEIKFKEVGGFLLPAEIRQTRRSPEGLKSVEVSFRNHQVNQPIPEEIKERLERQ